MAYPYYGNYNYNPMFQPAQDQLQQLRNQQQIQPQQMFQQQISGTELLPETLMSVVPAAATDVLTVNIATEICIDGCCSTIAARVIEGETVTVNTANIIVHREVA